MSAVVYIGDSIPERDLKRIRRYKAYLSKEEKAKILEELYPDSVPDNVDVQMYVDITVKEYTDPEKGNKNRQYDGIG